MSWCRSNCSGFVALAFLLCSGNLEFSEGQLSTVATTTAKDTLTTVRRIDCDLTTQCFLNGTQLDPLLNCIFSIFGETDPPCYGHWTSASSCSCDDHMHRISSRGDTYWCTDTGIWDNAIYDLKCQAPCITDSDENAIPRNSNGNVSVIILHGDFVTYTCPEGYIGRGTHKVDCSDGTWEPHEQFTCTEIPTTLNLRTYTTAQRSSTRREQLMSTAVSSNSFTFTSTPETIQTFYKTATIPTTIKEYETSDAKDILTSNEPTTSIYRPTETTTTVYATQVDTTIPSSIPVDLVSSDSSTTNTSLARRNCTDGSWDEPLLFQCYSQQQVAEAIEKIASANVTAENVEELANELAFLTRQADDLLTADVDKVADTLEGIIQAGSSSPKVTQSVVGIVNNVMEVDEADLDNRGSAETFIASLEQQISNFQKSSENFTEVRSNVGVKAVKVDPSVTEAITFITVVSGNRSVPERLNTDLSGENTLLLNDVQEVKREDSTSSIYLPPKVLQMAKTANPDLNKIPISFFIYKDSRLFQSSSMPTEDANSATEEEIVSQVIAAKVEIENIFISNLSAEDSIITRFLTNNLAKNSNSTISMVKRCVFWKVSEEDEKSGSWSTEGCEMISESSDNSQTVCRCSHLTSFAVILRSESTTYKAIDSVDTIAKVGTSLSVIGLTACILTLTLIKKSRQKQPTKIHINLYLCLIGFYITFLAGDLVKGNKQHCKNIASASHYFCLATVAWTCAEAVNMYILLLQHAKTKIEYFVLVSCILCYGLPLVPTIIVFILDGTNLEHYCFLHPGNFLYFGLLLEILVALIINIVLFSLVVQRIVCPPALSISSQKRKGIINRIQHFVLFWILLGLSWTFGFLLIIPTWASMTVTIEILFCIFAFLQGLILFIFTCVKNPDVMKIFKGTKRGCRENNGYWMKNRKGSYSVSEFHSKMEPRNARVESLDRNHAISEESEHSDCDRNVTYATISKVNERIGNQALSSESERESENKINPSVNEIKQSHEEETMSQQDKAPESPGSFRQNETQHNLQNGKERVKKKVVFV